MIRVFRHYIPVSLITLAAIELLILWFSIYIGVGIRFIGIDEGTLESVGPLMPKAVVFVSVMMILMIAIGLYQRNYREGAVGMLVRIIASFLVGFFLMTMLFYALPTLFLGRGAFGLAFVVAFIGILLSRFIFLGVVDQDTMKKRVMVLGAGNQALKMNNQLRRKTDRRGFLIVGFVSMPGEEDALDPKVVIPYDLPLVAIAQRHRIDEIVIAVDDRRKGLPVHDILDCKMSGIDIVDLLTFFERQSGKIKLEILHPSWMIFSDGFRQSVLRSYAKRSFDMVASLLLLAVTWPIMIITAVAIVLESRGGVFYKQVRVGENWKLFHILKFRSMKSDAEKGGSPQWAQQNDSRVTFIGKIIRKIRVDELPQIFNVLKGDMSFVGPRPERPEFVEELCDKIPYYAERHRVKPGITGWAQICYPYGASEQDALEKLQYDLYYVKNYSLFLDFTVLFQTVEVILWSRGAR